MKKTVIIIAVLMAFATTSYASPISQQWNKTYGGISIDVSTDIYQTLDGGYILAGFTDSFGVSIAGFGILAVKLNSNGEIQWQKVYKANNYFDIVNTFMQTEDGGYILAGYTFPFSSSTAMALILKLDEPHPKTGHGFLENSDLFERLLLNSEGVISPSDECGLKSL